MSWFYMSFVDDKFLGACLVQAPDERGAIIESKNRGCNPGGEVMVVWIEPEYGEPPKELQNVLFTDKEEMSRRFATWLGPQGAKTETVKERRERGGHLGASFVCGDCNDDASPSYD